MVRYAAIPAPFDLDPASAALPLCPVTWEHATHDSAVIATREMVHRNGALAAAVLAWDGAKIQVVHVERNAAIAEASA